MAVDAEEDNKVGDDDLEDIGGGERGERNEEDDVYKDSFFASNGRFSFTTPPRILQNQDIGKGE